MTPLGRENLNSSNKCNATRVAVSDAPMTSVVTAYRKCRPWVITRDFCSAGCRTNRFGSVTDFRFCAVTAEIVKRAIGYSAAYQRLTSIDPLKGGATLYYLRTPRRTL